MRRMSRRQLLFVSMAFLLSAGTSAPAAELPARSSSQDGVTVKVQPRAVTAQALEFQVTLDTHTQELKDDLTRTAVLVADGKQLAPAGWKGAPAGGHHRTGVLSFEPVAPAPKELELRIQRAGETSPRTFRWQLQEK
jgi:hypothetical protein